MIKRLLTQISRFLPTKNLKMSEMLAEAINKEGLEETTGASKREREHSDEKTSKKKQKTEKNKNLMQGRADRKRKVALLLVYSGKGYYGLQRNPGFVTIESELLKALVAAGTIPQDHADNLYKMSFQRAARTDKGVSAAGQVVSLKMLLNIDNLVEKINEHLPTQIRVLGYKRATVGFESKNYCHSRTYVYIMPTYALSPFETFVTDDYRGADEILKKTNEVLAMFIGTHNFHNFTSGIKPTDPSAKRYIISFKCDDHTFVRDGVEFVTITVKGQSFMMHHIRKMIGLTVAIVRGFCGIDVLQKSWTNDKLDIPKAPGLGLLLDQLHYDGYNNRFGKDGLHEPIEWEEYKEQIKDFKDNYIISEIVKTEKEEKVMFNWLSTLHFHKFDVIDPTKRDNHYSAKHRLNKLVDAKQGSPKKSEDNVLTSDVQEEKPLLCPGMEASSEGELQNLAAQETSTVTTSIEAEDVQKLCTDIKTESVTLPPVMLSETTNLKETSQLLSPERKTTEKTRDQDCLSQDEDDKIINEKMGEKV